MSRENAVMFWGGAAFALASFSLLIAALVTGNWLAAITFAICIPTFTLSASTAQILDRTERVLAGGSR